MLGIFSVQHKSSNTPQDDHKSNTGSITSGTPGTVQKEKVKGQMERRLSLMSGIALIVGTMIGKSCFIKWFIDLECYLDLEWKFWDPM